MGIGRAGCGAVEPAERRGSGGVGRRAQHVLVERSRRRWHAPLRRAAADPRHPLGTTGTRGRPRIRGARRGTRRRSGAALSRVCLPARDRVGPSPLRGDASRRVRRLAERRGAHGPELHIARHRSRAVRAGARVDLRFARTAPGGKTDLFQTARSDVSSPFASRVDPISDLNTAASEEDPWVSQDGRHILFVSDRDGRSRIYEARR